MRGLNTKKAITGVGITVGVLIGGFSYHEYKVISDENDKLTDKVNSQGTQIFEQNNLLMKNDQYISELENKNDEMVSKNNKLKKDKATLEKEKAKVKSELDKQNKTVKKLQKRINTLEAAEVSPTVRSAKTMSKKIPQDKVKQSSKTITMKATAYTAYCDTGCIGITKTGKDVSNTVYDNGNRVVAVDPSVIPLHSKLKVETANETFYAIALDTGGAIKNNRLDILVENHQKAVNFGVQEAKVTILN